MGWHLLFLSFLCKSRWIQCSDMLSLSPIQTWAFSPELLTYAEHNGIIQIHVEEMHAALDTSEFSKVFSKCLIVWKKSKSPVVPSYHKNDYKHTCTLARARTHTLP